MQIIIMTIVKLLIHQLIEFYFTGVPNYSGYQSNTGNYV